MAQVVCNCIFSCRGSRNNQEQDDYNLTDPYWDSSQESTDQEQDDNNLTDPYWDKKKRNKLDLTTTLEQDNKNWYNLTKVITKTTGCQYDTLMLNAWNKKRHKRELLLTPINKKDQHNYMKHPSNNKNKLISISFQLSG